MFIFSITTKNTYTEPVVLGAAIFIFSYLVCYERGWLRCSAAGVN